MPSARLRLASLWLSQTARAAADWCLRLFVVLGLGRAAGGEDQAAWHLATAVFIAPFLLLAPLNGALSNGLPRREVLVGAATFGMAAAHLYAVATLPPLACLALAALGTAVYSPTRYAMLPAAASECRLPLPGVNGWVELGGAAGAVAGVLLGQWLGGPEGLVTLLGLNVAAVLAALPARFAADVIRPEPPLSAVAGFFRDARRVFRAAAARNTLLGLAGFMALVTTVSGALMAHALGEGAGGTALFGVLVVVAAGAAAGSWLAGLQAHPRRVLGIVPFAATGLLAALLWSVATGSADRVPWLPCLLLGAAAGLVNVPLRAAYQAAVPADARGNGMAVMNTLIYLFTTALALTVLALARAGVLDTALRQLAFLGALAAVGAVVAWRALFIQALELLVESAFWPMYRIRARGPALESIPRDGPLVILANHTAWFDPVWLGVALPRRLTPMMSSLYYDRPVLRWIMRHVAGAIRVPAQRFKRDTPEVREAVKALDRGECVLLFPEGMVRRKEEVTLRQFGRGVWHILMERPTTPVVVCWIEGGWGSFTSHRGGPPAKNKRIDLRRPIDVAVSAPVVVPGEVLAEHRATRRYLMRRCLDAGRSLGLDLPAPAEDAEEPA